MKDVAVLYNQYQFLGNEFLTWLWFVIAHEPELIEKIDKDVLSLEIGKRMVVENNFHEKTERISIKADDAGLEEALVALGKGALVTEMSLILKKENLEYSFHIKGESLNISGLKLPTTGVVEKKEDVEGAVLEKKYLCDNLIVFVEKFYQYFMELRLNETWQKTVVPNIKKWIAH